MASQNRESVPTRVTATQRLATHLLGRDVRDFIAERRAENRAWRYIARDLYNATGGQVDVTYETLRQWSERGGSVNALVPGTGLVARHADGDVHVGSKKRNCG